MSNVTPIKPCSDAVLCLRRLADDIASGNELDRVTLIIDGQPRVIGVADDLEAAQLALDDIRMASGIVTDWLIESLLFGEPRKSIKIDSPR